MRSRTRRLAAAVSLTSALLLAVVPVAHAQDASPEATPSPFCAVLTPQEIQDAVGIEVAISAPDSSDTNCTYQADFSSGAFFLLDVRVDDGTLDDYKSFFPDMTDVTVGDRDAALSSDNTLLFIGIDEGLLTLQIVGTPGEGIDQAEAIQSLGATALGHLAGIPIPTPEPEPTDFSFVGDPELEALFPTTLGGEDLEIQSISGQELVAMNDDPETLAPLTDALAGLGKSLDDVSVGFGFSANGSLTGIRIAGVDATSVIDDILPLVLTDLENPIQEQVEIGGKQVIKVTEDTGGESPDPYALGAQYVYASGEVIWLVAADEPYLSEALGALP